MGLARGIAAPPLVMMAVVMIGLFSHAPVHAAGSGDASSQVRSSERKVEELQLRLSRLLAELGPLEDEYAKASGRAGVSYLKLEEAKAKAEEAKRIFNARARQAYKRGGIPQASLLLGVRTLQQLVGVTAFLGKSMRADLEAYARLVEAQDALREQREVLTFERRDLSDAAARLSQVRAEIQAALDSEQQILRGAQAELARLEAARQARVRGSTGVSPAVEARRAARQIELDRKLAAVLAWYAPGYGPEPYMPSKFRSTGIVSTGLSSWYGPGFDGRRAASGCTYRQEQLTAASRVLPFGTFLKVSPSGWGSPKAVIVVITDRGPYVDGRALDLSLGAAQAIGLTGVKSVRMEILNPNEPAPPYP